MEVVSSSKMWTLDEGIRQLLPGNPDEAEITNLGTMARQLTLDISIAEGVDDDGKEGISVLLAIPLDEAPDPDDKQDGRSQPMFWDFSCFMVPLPGETKAELIHRVASALGIQPDERIWQDGEI